MTKLRTYPHGATCWVDTVQPDLDAARRFYTPLFGWQVTHATPPDAPGTYLIATLDVRHVAALASARSDAATWNTYIAVDDADMTAKAVARGGGRVVVVLDPQDAEFTISQFTPPDDW